MLLLNKPIDTETTGSLSVVCPLLFPMQYVTRWRMQVAYEQLRNSETSVAEIAEQSGYQTEASFRKALKETTGV